MNFFDVLLECIWAASWRIGLCLLIGIGLAMYLHGQFPGKTWTWCVSIPLVTGALIIGWRWHSRQNHS